jgi:hypothetical protein
LKKVKKEKTKKKENEEKNYLVEFFDLDLKPRATILSSTEIKNPIDKVFLRTIEENHENIETENYFVYVTPLTNIKGRFKRFHYKMNKKLPKLFVKKRKKQSKEKSTEKIDKEIIKKCSESFVMITIHNREEVKEKVDLIVHGIPFRKKLDNKLDVDHEKTVNLDALEKTLREYRQLGSPRDVLDTIKKKKVKRKKTETEKYF